MMVKKREVWVLELDDTRGRYVLGVHKSAEACERYVNVREKEYDTVGYDENRIFRNGKGVRYIATKYLLM